MKSKYGASSWLGKKKRIMLIGTFILKKKKEEKQAVPSLGKCSIY